MFAKRICAAVLLLGFAFLAAVVVAQSNVRKELTRLSTSELLELRRAFELLQVDEGECGYQSFASTHGLPEPIYCPHGIEIFLWWHRAYIQRVEQCLQRYAPNIGIPFWDWTSDEAVRQGIPAALADLTYYDPAERREKPNPLYSALIGFNNTMTTRAPRDSMELGYLRQIIDRSLTYDNFTLFTDRYELSHDLLHVWVGGTMQQVIISSYDPLFYFHHTNVDRLLSTWQEIYPESRLSDEIKNVDLPPFSVTPEELIHVRYKYSYLYTPPSDTPYLICPSSVVRPVEYEVSVVMTRSMITLHSYLIDIEFVSVDDPSIMGKPVVTLVGRMGIFGEGMEHAETHKRNLERSLPITESAIAFGTNLCPSSGPIPLTSSKTALPSLSCPLTATDPDRPHLLRMDQNADAACPRGFPLVQLTVMQTTAGDSIPKEVSQFYKDVRISWTRTV